MVGRLQKNRGAGDTSAVWRKKRGGGGPESRKWKNRGLDVWMYGAVTEASRRFCDSADGFTSNPSQTLGLTVRKIRHTVSFLKESL